MKSSLQLALASMLLFTAVESSEALPVTIADNYYGATPTNAAYINKDIVGTVGTFDIKHLVVEVKNGILDIRINTSYFDNVGLMRTEFGDLFISSNGWNPFGSAPYLDDDHTNGEAWEYVVRFDNHGEAYSGDDAASSMIGASGAAALYEVKDKSEIELSAAAPWRAHRTGQEVQFNPLLGNDAIKSDGTWMIGALDPQGYSDLILSISLIGTPLEFVTDFGFHFAFSCGNDVIEGLYTREVPEPASLAMLGAACGLYGARRRRLKADA